MKLKNCYSVIYIKLVLIALLFFGGCDNDRSSLVPKIFTGKVKRVKQTNALSGGNIPDDGGEPISARGVVWSKTSKPTIFENEGITLDGVGTGEFVSSITNLSPKTSYFLRAYATNSEGTSYGNEISLLTSGGVVGAGVTDIDGNEYSTVIIGETEWMAENLRTTTYSNGMPIPIVTENPEWSNLTTGAYCWYFNDESLTHDHGALYNWHAVSSGNLCPVGWRVSTDEDWKVLEGTVDSQYEVDDPVWSNNGFRGFDAGRNLKSTYGWRLDINGGTDIYGLSCTPSGGRGGYTGGFGSVGVCGYWWTSTPFDNSNAWARSLYYMSVSVYRYTDFYNSAYSVRCVRES